MNSYFLKIGIFIVSYLAIAYLFKINYAYCDTNDKYYIRSTTNINYYDDNNQSVTIPVCLRALKKDVVIRKEDRGAGTTYGTLIYEANTWELVCAPDTPNESVIFLNNLLLVEGELHDGVLRNISLSTSSPEEKLFVYYIQYATSSMEEAYLFFYDINEKLLKPVKFRLINDKIENSFLFLGKFIDDLNISPINIEYSKKHKFKVSKYSLISKEFWVGEPNHTILSFWNFVEENCTFKEVYREVRNHETGKLIKKYKR